MNFRPRRRRGGGTRLFAASCGLIFKLCLGLDRCVRYIGDSERALCKRHRANVAFSPYAEDYRYHGVAAQSYGEVDLVIADLKLLLLPANRYGACNCGVDLHGNGVLPGYRAVVQEELVVVPGRNVTGKIDGQGAVIVAAGRAGVAEEIPC